MNDKKELIVRVDPNLIKTGKLVLVIYLIPISLFAGCYGLVRYYLTGTVYYLMSFLLVGPLIFFCLVFLMMILGVISFPKKGDVVAILNQDGIWLVRFGLIPWKEIDEFDTYSDGRTPLKIIGIRVKNNKKISKQSTTAGKLHFFWSKLMGYPPIMIAGIALSNDEVIGFAKQFLNP